MLTLTATDKTKLEKALSRAEEENLILSDLIPLSGFYIVSNPTHDTQYQVFIEKHGGAVQATCQCQGHQRGLVCKHIALAVKDLKAGLTARTNSTRFKEEM